MSEFKHTLDSNYCDSRRFDNVEVGDPKDLPKYTIKPANCFLGAWYRKVVSPKDLWLGIEAEIELGEFIPDPERFNLDGLGRNMDNPNLYVGGCADLESDCGIGYNATYPTADTSYELGWDAPRLGYRPFWRYIYKTRESEKGCTQVANVNSWNASNPEALCYYYFPGDVIRLKVYSPIPNYLQMKVEVIKTTTIEKYVKIREGYHLKDNKPCDFKSPLFHSAGQGVKATEFKRVNSIDQFGNEGFTAKLTKAKMTTATWFNCYLYKEKDGKLFKYPFTSDFQIDMRCPDESAIEVEEFNPALGGEKVTIHPETFIGFDKIK